MAPHSWNDAASRERFYYARRIGEEIRDASRALSREEQIEHRARAAYYARKLQALSEAPKRQEERQSAASGAAISGPRSESAGPRR